MISSLMMKISNLYEIQNIIIFFMRKYLFHISDIHILMELIHIHK